MARRDDLIDIINKASRANTANNGYLAGFIESRRTAILTGFIASNGDTAALKALWDEWQAAKTLEDGLFTDINAGKLAQAELDIIDGVPASVPEMTPAKPIDPGPIIANADKTGKP